MGFTLLTTYDVNACAQACNTRAYDATSGPCIYFNIWQAVVNGAPSAITCSMVSSQIASVLPIHDLNTQIYVVQHIHRRFYCNQYRARRSPSFSISRIQPVHKSGRWFLPGLYLRPRYSTTTFLSLSAQQLLDARICPRI